MSSLAWVSGLLILGAILPTRADDCVLAVPSGETMPSEQGLVYATSKQRFVAVGELIRRLETADYALLGETHDDPLHHALQRFALARIAATGRKPAVVFEMFNRADRESILRAANAVPADPDAVAEAARWSESGWPAWPLYRPIVETAMQSGLALVPGNFARSRVRDLAFVSGWDSLGAETLRKMGLLQPLPEGPRQLLLATLVSAHPGAIPEPYLHGMLRAQRLRDASMADAMLSADPGAGAVLIAGREHARLDYGVPFYLRLRRPQASVVSVGFMQARDLDPARLAADEDIAHDFVWLTPSESAARRIAHR